MSERPLSEALDRIQVSLALQGRHGYRLPPRLWEAARVNLQNQYRMATGEPDAVVSISSGERP